MSSSARRMRRTPPVECLAGPSHQRAGLRPGRAHELRGRTSSRCPDDSNPSSLEIWPTAATVRDFPSVRSACEYQVLPRWPLDHQTFMRRRSASRSAITLSSWRSTASSPGSPIGPPASGGRDTPVRSAKHAAPCSLQSAPGGYVSTNARGRDEAAVRSGGTLAAPCRGLVRGLGPCKLPARPGLCVLSRVASVQVTLSPHADVLMVMRRSESVVLVSQAVAGLVDQGGQRWRRPESPIGPLRAQSVQVRGHVQQIRHDLQCAIKQVDERVGDR